MAPDDPPRLLSHLQHPNIVNIIDFTSLDLK